MYHIASCEALLRWILSALSSKFCVNAIIGVQVLHALDASGITLTAVITGCKTVLQNPSSIFCVVFQADLEGPHDSLMCSFN
jgi:hypothetical protein